MPSPDWTDHRRTDPWSRDAAFRSTAPRPGLSQKKWLEGGSALQPGETRFAIDVMLVYAWPRITPGSPVPTVIGDI